MDSASMKAAMEAMQSMSPEQMRNMMSAMGNVSPDMMAQAQSMASNMSPSDWSSARNAMSSMTPEQMQQQAGTAQQQFNAQAQYLISGSQQVKNEGNRLHSSGKYQEAIEKYERAKSTISAQNTSEAMELRKACTLNLSSCYLNLKQWEKCIQQCNEALAGEADSLKALYRRGQAHLGSSQWAEAVEDLSRAVKLSASDPAQAQLIQEKLQDAKKRLSEQPAIKVSSASSPVSTPAAIITSPNQQQVVGGGASSGPALTPDMLQAAAEMMKSNPAWAQQADEMMRGMSDADLANMSATVGAPVTREQLAAGREAMARLDPQQLEGMAKMQSVMPPELAARLRANPHDQEALAATSRILQDNPDMASTAAQMMSNMSSEQLAAIAQQAGMPAGTLTPESVKAAAQSLKNMDPQEVARMTERFVSMQLPISAANTGLPAPNASGSRAGSGALATNATSAISAGPGGMPAMTPEMAKMAAEMMGSMSPEQLQAMTASMPGGGGMAGMTPEMAKMAADMMGKMTPADMERMSSMMGAMGAGGPGGFPGAPGTPGMGSGGAMDMMSNMDPKMMEQGMSMMRNMDAASLAGMLASSGMAKSPEQGEQMAKQMQSMSETQVKMMVKVATVAQTGYKGFRKAKEVFSNRMVLISLLVLLIAVLLRWYGMM